MNIDIEYIKDIVLKAGKLIKERSEVDFIKEKGTADFVTGVDLSVQKFIYENLCDQYPTIQFLSEESDNSNIDLNEYVWILDPVDGTTNLIHDYQASVISLALAYEKEVILGIIYNPYLEELFLAQKGKGSYLNGNKIHVSRIASMEHSLISIGTSPYYKSMAEENFEVFKKVFMDTQDIRRSGSAALDLAYIAYGRIEGYFERNLKLWDYAAGCLIIKEAGGKVLDYEGNGLTLEYVNNVVAGNDTIPEILCANYLANEE